jgi:hypothetical protein
MSKVTTLAASRQRATGASLAFTDTERTQILDHIESIFLSPAFRNSKRNCALLRYVVKRALDGQADQLKERTIGVEAFGRQADYDTNVDHSVRSAAGEVRRRLAQYYMECGTESGVRIEVLPGSYVPQIRIADRMPVLESIDSSLAGSAAPRLVSGSQANWLRRLSRHNLERLAAIAAVPILGFALSSAWRVPTPFDQLWNPILASPNPALLCFGGGRPGAVAEAPATVADFERLPARRMNVSDALALVAVTGTLRASGKQYRILSRANSTSFKDLQQGPFVLIGAMNNEWTLRLTEGLRFNYQHPSPGDGSHIADRKNPGNISWSFRYSAPFTDVMRDYAIVTRVRDPKTEQFALIVAGLGSWGTQAAAEFVTNPNHVKKLEPFAPRNWQQKNLQVVLATDVIHGSSGPPIVLAADFW